jgi:hypothetical protein
MIKFPYGNADFYKIMTENYYFVDRTDKIPLLEEAGDTLLFLRPRRFGKSLWLSVLENYYDIRKAGEFDRLFGKLAAGQNPAPLHNQYLILKWNFSTVAASGDEAEMRQFLHNHLNSRIREFIIRYQKVLPHPVQIDSHDATVSFSNLLSVSQATPYKVYLLIDEYDNFANEVLMSGLPGSEKRYDRLIKGEGMLKTVFKAVKDGTEGRGIDRIFITGVSPVVMSDITSGFNIADNIYLEPQFNDLCGFHEHEVAEAVSRVAEICRFTPEQTGEALMMMRAFYDGYCFSYTGGGGLYNPTLVFYFLKYLQRQCQSPRKMLDSNLAMDRGKIAYVAGLPHGGQVVSAALNKEEPLAINELSDRFGIKDVLEAVHDKTFMVSLLWYFGVLTLSETRTPQGKLMFRIPNLVIRRLYVERIQEMVLPDFPTKEDALRAAECLYQNGDIQPLCDFIEQHPFSVFDSRDLRWTNELVIKTIFLTLLFNDTFYIMDSEASLKREFADLIMIVRPDMRQYALLDILIEFKFVPLGKNKLSGEQVRSMTDDELRASEPVKKAISAAKKKLTGYRQTLRDIYGERLRLHTFAVVAVGLNRLVWEKLEN